MTIFHTFFLPNLSLYPNKSCCWSLQTQKKFASQLLWALHHHLETWKWVVKDNQIIHCFIDPTSKFIKRKFQYVLLVVPENTGWTTLNLSDLTITMSTSLVDPLKYIQDTSFIKSSCWFCHSFDFGLFHSFVLVYSTPKLWQNEHKEN